MKNMITMFILGSENLKRTDLSRLKFPFLDPESKTSKRLYQNAFLPNNNSIQVS